MGDGAGPVAARVALVQSLLAPRAATSTRTCSRPARSRSCTSPRTPPCVSARPRPWQTASACCARSSSAARARRRRRRRRPGHRRRRSATRSALAAALGAAFGAAGADEATKFQGSRAAASSAAAPQRRAAASTSPRSSVPGGADRRARRRLGQSQGYVNLRDETPISLSPLVCTPRRRAAALVHGGARPKYATDGIGLTSVATDAPAPALLLRDGLHCVCDGWPYKQRLRREIALAGQDRRGIYRDPRRPRLARSRARRTPRARRPPDGRVPRPDRARARRAPARRHRRAPRRAIAAHGGHRARPRGRSRRRARWSAI